MVIIIAWSWDGKNANLKFRFILNFKALLKFKGPRVRLRLKKLVSDYIWVKIRTLSKNFNLILDS